MTSSRPYLLRALYEWINDNNKTPYIVVDAAHNDVIVPNEYVDNGKIVFNIALDAVMDLQIDNVQVQFHATFSGLSRHIKVPMDAVLAVYAQENGAGMVFSGEPGGNLPPDNSKFETNKNTTKKSHLKVIK